MVFIDVCRLKVAVQLVHCCASEDMCPHVLMNFVCVRVHVREDCRERQRPTTTRARSPDIIEDDISDYSKDRNLSLSVITFSVCCALTSVLFFRLFKMSWEFLNVNSSHYQEPL